MSTILGFTCNIDRHRCWGAVGMVFVLLTAPPTEIPHVLKQTNICVFILSYTDKFRYDK